MGVVGREQFSNVGGEERKDDMCCDASEWLLTLVVAWAVTVSLSTSKVYTTTSSAILVISVNRRVSRE
jgi:hypothetical protein